MYSRQEAIAKMNQWGGNNRPFLFILNFEGNNNLLYPLDELPDHINYGIDEQPRPQDKKYGDFSFEIAPVPFNTYEKAFRYVLAELNYGNSYLVNLTFPTNIKTGLDLETIYQRSRARYKLLIKNKLVVFSPESFVKITNQKICAYPMKGTIDASIPNAEKLILDDPKEAAEHATIVDLIRNDLNRIAENVRVERFRYIEKLDTFKRSLLQVSSEIVGDLPDNFWQNLGTLFFTLLPAGSISGAPKEKTIEIIKKVEIVDRGFFTGVFGVFDGKSLDSAVMIRFIEKQDNQLIFKSGGGITSQSQLEAEYDEMIHKVYVPFV